MRSRPGRRVSALLGVASAVALLGAAPAVRAEDEAGIPEGVVLVLGGLSGEAQLAAARVAGGARFRLGVVEPRAQERPPPPGALLRSLRARYLEADFLRCLTTLSDPSLSFAGLLEEGHREAAAHVGVFGAACAFGAGDPELSGQLLARVFAAELPAAPPLRVTSPDFQGEAERVREATVAAERVRLRLQTRPRGARVMVDGGVHRCRATPCDLSVLAGDHVITVAGLGYARRTVQRTLAADTDLRLALDPAAGPEQHAQLGAAIASGQDPDGPRFVRAVAMAFGARVVVIVRANGEGASASLYDRARDRILARTTVVRADQAPAAVRSVIAEWRGITEPTPLLQEPLFWLGAGAVALATGIVVFLLVSPGEPRHDIVFFSR